MDGGAEERQRGCEHDHEVDERETTPEVPSSDSSDGSEGEQADEGAPAEECPAAAPSDREEGELEDADDLPDHDDDDPITAQQLHELPVCCLTWLSSFLSQFTIALLPAEALMICRRSSARRASSADGASSAPVGASMPLIHPPATTPSFSTLPQLMCVPQPRTLLFATS